ncbi:MAG: transcription termination/antitermination protein NusG [Bryobacteraceae bacterium]|jgi:transcriptional antiterminator NusG|nr:transcription termination/antitermination protein NusG [Bryobacteraceae bacterium]
MEKHWYTIQTYVGYEYRVKAALQQKIREQGLDEAFGEILVPTEKVIDMVRGKKQTVERRLFPGYLFVQMALNEDTWHLVHSVPKVIGFIGESDTAPAPVPEPEIDKIRARMEASAAAPRPRVSFTIGDKVKVVDGPFRDFVGTVEAVKPEHSRVRVAVSVFGRQTPVELDFQQVEAA